MDYNTIMLFFSLMFSFICSNVIFCFIVSYYFFFLILYVVSITTSNSSIIDSTSGVHSALGYMSIVIAYWHDQMRCTNLVWSFPNGRAPKTQNHKHLVITATDFSETLRAIEMLSIISNILNISVFTMCIL